MPATLVANKIGTNSSALRGVVACTAGATSLDVLTVNHLLGATPHEIILTMRSVPAAASITGTNLLVLSYDATKVLFQLPIAPGGGATSVTSDIVMIKAHTIVR